MNNLLYFAEPPESGERRIALPIDPTRPMQMIAAEDIGHFVADAFDSPEQSIGRQVELAGDAMTFPDVAKIYERVTGVPTRFEPQPIEERMFEWFVESGYQADIPTLRRQHPAMLTFDEFLTAALASTPNQRGERYCKYVARRLYCSE